MQLKTLKYRYKNIALYHGEFNRDEQVKYMIDCGVLDFVDIIDIIQFIEFRQCSEQLYNDDNDNFIDTPQNYLKYCIEKMRDDFQRGVLDKNDEYDKNIYEELKKSLKE